jgi:hypothetical protein
MMRPHFSSRLPSLPRLFGAAAPAPDFLRPVRGPHGLAWLLCAAALVGLVLAVLDAHRTWQERAEALAQRDDAVGRVERLRAMSNLLPAAPAKARDDAWPLLAHPWLAVFQSVEAASLANVRWLAFEHGVDGALRLEGQTADAGAALQVADALQASPLWHEVGLSRIERSDTAATSQRFDLKARRADGTPWKR